MFRRKAKREWDWFYTVLAIVLAVYVIVLFGPILWAFFTSFKDRSEYAPLLDPIYGGNKLGVPQNWTAYNYQIGMNPRYFYGKALNGVRFGLPGLFVNSLLYAIGCAVTATAVPCFTAYVVARYHYRFSKVLYAVVIVVMALPIVGSLPSEIEVATQLGIRNTFPGIWIMKANFLGIYFLVFYAQFKQIPASYSEASSIDGASNLRTMFQIVLPQATGTISTVFLLNFVLFWNDYQTPMNYLQNNPVLALGMIQFFESTADISGTKMSIDIAPIKLAGTLFAALPIVLIALIFSRKLTSNISVGGLKE